MTDRELFFQEVYQVVKAIPPGAVLTYGQIARLIGWPQHARLVGKAMSCIPSSLLLPSHRVVNSQGNLVPHWPQQRELLAQEGVSFTPAGRVCLRKHQWRISTEAGGF